MNTDTNENSTKAANAPSSDLSGYDEEQIRLMEEVCIVVDREDKVVGQGSKKECMLIDVFKTNARRSFVTFGTVRFFVV